MRTDFENIEEGARVRLFPNESNPLHKKPVEAVHFSGYFYCDGTDPSTGPDYYFRDVAEYNSGFEVIT